MDAQQLYTIVQKGIHQQLPAPVPITPGLRLKEDLGLPSIKLAFFLTAVTEELQLSLFDLYDYELLGLKTVGDVVALLSKKLNMDASTSLFDPGLVIDHPAVRLRLVTLADLPALTALAADPALWTFYPFDLAQANDLEAYVKQLLTDHANHKNVPFVIVDKTQGDRVVGMSSFGNVSFPDKRIEIGWSWIGKAFQGTGINGLYKYLMLSYAFEVLQFVRVEFKTDVLNVQARKALLKIGATEEGILRSHTQMHSHRRRDTIYYSVLQAEWALLKDKPHASHSTAGRSI